MNQQQKVLNEHKQLLMLTGRISEFHMKNLKNWPYVLFNKEDVKDVNIDYNFIKIDADEQEAVETHAVFHGIVTYDLGLKKDFEEEELHYKLSSLVNWTKTLFWEDTEVMIKLNGELWVN